MISRAWKCLLLWRISILGGAFEQKRSRKKKKGGGGGAGRVLKRFRSHVILKYTPAMRSRIWSKLILATLCVILRSRVLIISVRACICAVLGLGDRAGCGEGGGVGGGEGG